MESLKGPVWMLMLIKNANIDEMTTDYMVFDVFFFGDLKHVNLWALFGKW